MPPVAAADLVVRPMLPADLPQTLDVWVAAWQAVYPAIDFEARRGWTADWIAELERAGSQSLIVARGERIVGALSSMLAPDISTKLLLR